ncbi:MAG: Nif3-like dinuclear metal center hexameric protein [Planctomycetes bacterium]|nr:Nif3-like dinuclear metal center hexameric protein [Planctomycetota bacterium]
MVTPCDIAAYIEELKGWQINREEGVHHGRWDHRISAVTVCWKATPEALEDAGRRGDDLVIGHESLYDPYDFDFNAFVRPGWQNWGTNERRKKLLQKYNLTFLRLHSSVDGLYVGQGFADMLELGEPTKAHDGAPLWEIEQCPLSDLVRRVKEKTGLPSLRVCAPKGLEQKVSKIGLLIGGAGLDSNVGGQQRLIDAGCDVLISGESDNYGFRFAAENGIPTIETSHEVCENPGLRRFCGVLAGRFTDLRFTFYENPCVWQMA